MITKTFARQSYQHALIPLMRDLVFEIADATAHRGFLYADSYCCLPEAAVLGGGNNITQMTKFNSQFP